MFKKSLTIAIVFAIVLSCSPVYAGGHHGGGHGRWIGPAFGGMAAGLLIGSMMHRDDVVYVHDNYYYRPVETRYVYVDDPIVVPTVYIINIVNSDGSIMSISLRKINNGWIGPQGEFYSAMPSVERLRIMYGR